MLPIAIGALAGGGLGLLQGQNNEKKMYQDMILKSEMAKYAPYSAMAQSIASAPSKDLPDQSASLFSGMATGASAGSLFGKAGAAKVADAGEPLPTIGANQPGQYSLGGKDAAARLGQRYLNMENQLLPFQFQFQDPSFVASK